MYQHDGFWMWGGGGIFMVLFGILLLLAIAALVRLLASSANPPGSAGSGRKRALEVLEERYAKGEIDRDEYLQKRQDLEG